MQLGMIGLGRMGANMAMRLLKAGHDIHAYAQNSDSTKSLEEAGAKVLHDVEAFVSGLARPRAVWLMVPAAAVDSVLETITPALQPGDIVIDGGNSYFHDDLRRARSLRRKELKYVDVGVSGGVWGRERGYCLMIGGEKDAVDLLDSVFRALAPGVNAASRTAGAIGEPAQAEYGYLHCGPNGAGHFVKMVHNGIEYGLMAAFAEGLAIIRKADIGRTANSVDAETAPLRDPALYQYDFDVGAIAELWRRGSVVSSWLLDLLAVALHADPKLAQFSGRVSDSGEGRWTLQAAIDESVPAPVIASALFSRFASRGEAQYEDKLLSALRFEFGGHIEKSDG